MRASERPPACTCRHSSVLVLPAPSVRPGARAGARRRQRAVEATDGPLPACGGTVHMCGFPHGSLQRSLPVACGLLRSRAVFRAPVRSHAVSYERTDSCAVESGLSRSRAVECGPVRSCAILRGRVGPCAISCGTVLECLERAPQSPSIPHTRRPCRAAAQRAPRRAAGPRHRPSAPSEAPCQQGGQLLFRANMRGLRLKPHLVHIFYIWVDLRHTRATRRDAGRPKENTREESGPCKTHSGR